MTGEELKAVRERLGFTLVQMGWAMGYRGRYTINSQWKLESGSVIVKGLKVKRRISRNRSDLAEAFLSGWRPNDWPEGWE